MTRAKLIVLVFASILICAGCESAEDAANSTGTVTGIVKLISPDGSYLQKASGISVSIDSTSFSTETDSTGNWTISNLPAGYYTFHFSKAGYTEIRQSGVTVIGGATFYWSQQFRSDPVLAPLLNFIVDFGKPEVRLSVSPPDTLFTVSFPSLFVHDSLGQSVVNPNVLILAGRKPPVDYRDTSSYFAYHFANSNNFVDLSSQYQNVHSGDTIYFTGYVFRFVPPTYTYYVGNREVTAWSGFGRASGPMSVVMP